MNATVAATKARGLLTHRPPGLPWLFQAGAAAALFVGGYEHLRLYQHGYRVIPTIGTLFALNVATSAVIGLVLLVRRELIVRVAALSVAATTLGFFVASRTGHGVFHFREIGFQPSPQALTTVVAESAAIVILAASFAWDVVALRRPGPA